MKDNSKQFKNKWILILSIITLCSRIGYLIIWGGFDNQIRDSVQDQYTYIMLAENLATNKGFTVNVPVWVANPGKPTAIFPPLYPLFISWILQLFNYSLAAIRLTQVFLSLIVIWVVFDLGCKIFNHTTGIVSGLVSALYPALVMYPRLIMSEGFFFPLIAILVWMTHRITQNDRRWYHYGSWGLAAGLSILTRTESFILAGLLFSYLLFYQVRNKIFSWSNSIVIPAVVVILT
jgi:4-amino-4-deoxy-L-arabinose transferase-like glycosyltransferase